MRATRSEPPARDSVTGANPENPIALAARGVA
jgi:hypothetical protein